ncbi:hypothetical protein [Candidatus Nitrotoga sp. BS]|uniref:hypothetical protein n=1 Tax=Candidatus Nitrotoga sp. BS TaxID=2890408 RepID=UPI001EF2B9C5|nr:hypothetical protein [Candidatus Nitrotoga sp. BS]
MLIWLLSLKYAKEQMYPLTHCGTEEGHLGLTSGKQAFINSFDTWVVARVPLPNYPTVDPLERIQICR